MKKGTFNASAFYSALDSVRSSKSLTWKDISVASGVSASTLTRMAQGKRPDVDSLAALVQWSGLSSDNYMIGLENTSGDANTVATIGTYLRADKELTPDAAAALESIVQLAYQQLRKKTTDGET